ncbi:acyltransferase family protein, partial [Nostocoides japonicum]|uniref:acyltransferase family protein n=1 Tax=Nostocoides japonicum TaxID=99481 RepID=UPI0012F9A318
MGAPETFRGDVQGLRGVAVLLVLVGHAGLLGLTGGYVGVDVFFVISGFLITGIMVRDVERHGTVRLGTFYARRARRILPAATATLVLTAAASCLVYTTGHLLSALRDVTWAALFAANVNYARAGTGYFATSDFVSPVQHFWSLGVEEQFYLLWPALLALLAVAGTRHTRRWALLAVTALTTASFAWSLWDTVHHSRAAYFSTFTRGWELGVGALLALAAGHLHRIPPVLRSAATWLGLGLVATASLAYTEATAFPGWHATLPVAGSALVLAGGVGRPRGSAGLVLDRGPMRVVGDISYSLYLVHWPLLILPAAYLGRVLTTSERGLLVLLALPAAWLSHRYVETPLRHPRAARPRTSRSLLLWPAAPAAVLAVAFGLGSYATAVADVPARTVESAPAGPA